MRLPTEPRHQRVGAVVVTVGDEAPVGADSHREHRCAGGDIGKASLQHIVDVSTLLLGIVFDGEQPRVQNRARGPVRRGTRTPG